jgi:hypothetical protein
MAINRIEEMLSGGHPNSLGNTVQVVDEILKNKRKLNELYKCYKSPDAVVRLRVSSAMKRVCKAHPDWVAGYLDGLLTDISRIDQASTKWTLATLFMLLDEYMDEKQRQQAIAILKKNLYYDDWIVQNTTSEVLAHFAIGSADLKRWLQPELQKLTSSRHNSVRRRAEKLLNSL